MIDRRGIVSFLAITFAITFTIEGTLILSGFTMLGLPALYAQLVVVGVMWVPALATVITIKYVTGEDFSITNFRFGPWQPYLYSALLIPACFVVIYALTWLLGLGEPDWDLSQFRELVESAGGTLPSDINPTQLLLVLFLVSIVVGPTVNGLVAFGEEYGWRGYLLPKLMPLGKRTAYVLVGAIWGLWHAPLVFVGFNYPGYPLLGIIAMMGFTTTLSIYINELTLRYRSSVLAASIHGAVNGQGNGIWGILFPMVNPLLGGATGLVGMAVWVAIGLW